MASAGQAQAGEARAQARGVRVMLLLLVLTVVEYGVAIGLRSSPVVLLALLAPMALLEAWMIATYFMHAARLWRGEEEHA